MARFKYETMIGWYILEGEKMVFHIVTRREWLSFSKCVYLIYSYCQLAVHQFRTGIVRILKDAGLRLFIAVYVG